MKGRNLNHVLLIVLMVLLSTKRSDLIVRNASVHEEMAFKWLKICNKKFTGNNGLKTNIDSVHEKKKPHICVVCDSKFAGKANLERHVFSVHESAFVQR